MTQHSDRLLRDKMSQASVEELMDSFDEAAIWQQISKENSAPSKVKRLYGMQYWPYAAVLLLGVLLGFYLDRNKEAEQLTAQRHIHREARNEPVFMAAPSTATAHALSSSSLKEAKRIKEKTLIDNGSANSNELPLTEERKTETLVEEKEIAVVTKQEIKVVYFEDMQAENKLVAATSQKKSKRKLLQVNMPQSKDVTTQELPLRSFVYALNK